MKMYWWVFFVGFLASGIGSVINQVALAIFGAGVMISGAILVRS